MKYAPFLIFLFIVAHLSAQDFIDSDMRFIEVTGSAKMEVVPDQITLQFTLEEYRPRKDIGKKVEIHEIEGRLMDLLKRYAVKQEDIVLDGFNNSWYRAWYYRRQLTKRKSIQVTFRDMAQLNAIFAEVDGEGISNISIASTSHHELTEFRKEVKKNAIVAAREKAAYLLEALGENVGRVKSVHENATTPHYWYRQNTVTNVNLGAMKGGEEVEGVKPILLQYEVKVLFEIE